MLDYCSRGGNTLVPFSVHVHGDPEKTATLVLSVSYPFLLVGPEQGSSRLRWITVDDCDLARVLYDRPWHEPFTGNPDL
jgi:hypothetical protein